VRTETHCERVLGLLTDGEPHSHHELYALHVVAHSRVSDLRKRGHVINHWRDGETSYYQLVSLGEPDPPATAGPDKDEPTPTAGANAMSDSSSGSPSENDPLSDPPETKAPFSLGSSGDAPSTTGVGEAHASPVQLSLLEAA
jgi:hypothetical protein